ncbi:MAG: 23S rRNA (adenine(2030)-N(6))-methyltransferase RlmJ [Steroidobacteraceae bacterium]
MQALARKDKGFLYLETHAGRGAYDLAKSDEGRASAPAIERVIADASEASAHSPAQPEMVAYARAIEAWRSRTDVALAYPGSPLIAAMQLRAQDRAVLIELLPNEAADLGHALAVGCAAHVARVVAGDGFEQLKAFLPPAERRGLTLIDPPYEEARQELARIEAALAEALRRFATGIVAVWYPIKDARDTAAWLAALRPQIARETLVSELWLHPCDSRVALNGSGLLIVNPPYGIAERMRVWLPALLALLDPTRAGDATGTSSATGTRSASGTRSSSGTSVRLL